ncbi:MAG: DNA repair protein RadA [Oscillospiraceae bacterium]|nr:DNA repair protein RadA [Oscillospiraceae bacterium]
MKASKTLYVCTECDYQSPKWLGRCPECKSWNTLEEQTVQNTSASSSASKKNYQITSDYESVATLYDELDLPEYMRNNTGLGELDRVLGGGLVSGSVILLSGEPGIGKSTLLTQISASLGDNKILYISGEESRSQLKLRAERLKLKCPNLYVLTETSMENILNEINKIKPDVIIVDSIQTVYSDNISSAPGSIAQVKEAAMRFINIAKNENISIILVGHVNKEGGIAGPKVLEHMVDAVLYFEGERQNTYRIIRAVKNRFGSTNEIGVFEMTEVGLVEIPNPSEMLLADRPKNISGNCAVCIMEGTRPIIAEVQALATTTVFPSPKRTSNGIDYNRMCLLLAVLEKRFGLRFSTNDVYMNVIGGLKIEEPAADLAITLALISSIKDQPIPDNVIAFGEVGLAGECRAISNIEQRIKEATRLGFNKIILPYRSIEKLKIDIKDIELIAARSVFDIIKTPGILT